MDAVRVYVYCALPEVLVQRAMDGGVRFIAIEPEGRNALLATLTARHARRFLKLCGRFSIDARVVSRRGRSALSRWLRRRWTVLPGLLLGLAACWLLLGRIWTIDIHFTGDAARRGDPAALRAALSAMDIRPGISRRLDAARLSGELTAAAEGFSYVGARVEGVRLFIEAAPEVAAPEVYDVAAPRNLYAAMGGIVTSVNVEAGEPCVKPGDTVRRGQLLIRGTEKASSEETRPIAALGQVMIRTWYEGAATGALREAKVRFTGRRSVSAALETPWFTAPIVEGETFAHQAVEAEYLPVGGLFLPVRLTRVTARETRATVEAGDRALLEARLSALAMADARAALTRTGPGQIEILRTWVRFTRPDDDTLRAGAVCEILTDAAAAGQPPPQGG